MSKTKKLVFALALAALAVTGTWTAKPAEAADCWITCNSLYETCVQFGIDPLECAARREHCLDVCTG